MITTLTIAFILHKLGYTVAAVSFIGLKLVASILLATLRSEVRERAINKAMKDLETMLKGGTDDKVRRL
jgi:hypothetical protein